MNGQGKYKLAFGLWQRWFEGSGDPWIVYREIDYYCYFCGEDKPNHLPDCIYVVAKKLIEGEIIDAITHDDDEPQHLLSE